MTKMMSDDISKLAMALSKFQGAVGSIPKTKTAKLDLKAGGSDSYSYADLADIQDHIREPATQNELSHSQLFAEEDKRTYLFTYVFHSSGQWLCSKLEVANHEKIQQLGSEITYLRRYGLSAAYGLVTDKDDDGGHANNVDRKTGELKQPEPQKTSAPDAKSAIANGDFISEKQVKYFFAITKDYPDYLETTKKKYAHFDHIPKKEFNTVLAHFEEWKKGKEPKKEFEEECPF